MNLQTKIDDSIALIRKAERLALLLQPDTGFYVAFSGGKDSQTVLELVKMAGVKYRAFYNVTTNDPADNIRFIKYHYPEVIFDSPNKSYFQLIAKKGLPTRIRRWCCAIFKEPKGAGHAVLTGVRKQESQKRAKYNNVKKYGERTTNYDIDEMEKNEFRCVNGKDKFLINPILEWTESEVWEFLRFRGLPVNPCYTYSHRVGCIFCPFASKKTILLYAKKHPKQTLAFIHAIESYMKNSNMKYPLSAEELFDWWISKKSIKAYLATKSQLTLPL